LRVRGINNQENQNIKYCWEVAKKIENFMKKEAELSFLIVSPVSCKTPVYKSFIAHGIGFGVKKIEKETEIQTGGLISHPKAEHQLRAKSPDSYGSSFTQCCRQSRRHWRRDA
jgi:hypothetical protein